MSMEALKALVSGGNSELKSLPDQLTYILGALNDPAINSAFRSDILDLLSGSCKLARILCDETYSAAEGIRRATGLLHSLAQLIFHLENRPATYTYGIFNPGTGSLRKQVYATSAEAGAFATADELIVPVMLTSQVTLQPKVKPNAGPITPNTDNSPDTSSPSEGSPGREPAEL